MLTEEQAQAHDGVVGALQSGHACLTGGPGVGKTYTTRAIVETLQRQGLRVACAASTNKAATVLSQALGVGGLQATTIHKLCGLRVDEVRGTSKLTQSGPSRLAEFDVVLVDETSMLDDALVDVIESQASAARHTGLEPILDRGDHEAGTRLLYIGDKNQLNPVNQPFIARPFRTPDLARFELTQVMRQQKGSNIAGLLDPIREHIEHNAVLTAGAFSEADLDDLRITSRENLSTELDRLAHAPGDNVFIAWRNQTVNDINQSIRERRFGLKAVESDFLPDETVMLRAPFVINGQVVATTGECFTVTASVLAHQDYQLGAHCERVRYWSLRVAGRAHAFRVVDRASRAGWLTVLNYKRHAALSAKAGHSKSAWWDFYNTRDSMTDLQTRAAITSHRSQGSTYGRVMVDASDILRNPNTDEAARCLYVACSRPRSHLTLIF